MSDLLATLNPEQIKAASHQDGPALILAGAGSGKTKALTHRMAYLYLEKGVPLNSILAITFTNKAAREMKDRVMKLVKGANEKILNVSTFHAFCAKLLRREAGHLGYGSSFSILDANDSLSLIKKIMTEMGIDTKRIYPEAVKNLISSAKNELIGPSEYAGLASGSLQEAVAKIYPIYQQRLQENNATDFDDLIMLTVRLFTEHPTVLAKYQNKFRYVLIDEYQDTNTAQYTLANQLVAAHRNLFVVGDDWQSIYSWRGANYENILNFSKDYPEAVVIKLEQNYRSTQVILDAAHAVIASNRHRSDKRLWTAQADGELIVAYEALNDRDEGEFVIRKVEELRGQGANLDEIVVLYRTNAQSRNLEEICLRHDMPYRVVGGVKFYDRREVRDMVAWLTLLQNPNNDIAVERIINVPARGIGPKGLEQLHAQAREAGISLLEYILHLPQPQAGVTEFAKIVKEIGAAAERLKLSQLLDLTMRATGYTDWLKTEGIEGEGRLENVRELKSVMEKYDTLPTAEALTAFLEEVSLIADLDNQGEDRAAITLMTIHTAKGLEFDYVFVVGMEENVFPHSRSLFEQAELEEERRLAYVAITRARKQIFLTYARERLLYGNVQNNPASRFVADIPDDLIERLERHTDTAGRTVVRTPSQTTTAQQFQPGKKVVHQQFGEGTVIARSGEVVTVAFVKEGIKNLIPELAKLQLK